MSESDSFAFINEWVWFLDKLNILHIEIIWKDQVKKIILSMKGGLLMLGEKIYNLRKKQNLSQEQLSELINVTRQTISNWELGNSSPNPEQLKLLSK